MVVAIGAGSANLLARMHILRAADCLNESLKALNTTPVDKPLAQRHLDSATQELSEARCNLI